MIRRPRWNDPLRGLTRALLPAETVPAHGSLPAGGGRPRGIAFEACKSSAAPARIPGQREERESTSAAVDPCQVQRPIEAIAAERRGRPRPLESERSPEQRRRLSPMGGPSPDCRASPISRPGPTCPDETPASSLRLDAHTSGSRSRGLARLPLSVRSACRSSACASERSELSPVRGADWSSRADARQAHTVCGAHAAATVRRITRDDAIEARPRRGPGGSAGSPRYWLTIPRHDPGVRAARPRRRPGSARCGAGPRGHPIGRRGGIRGCTSCPSSDRPSPSACAS